MPGVRRTLTAASAALIALPVVAHPVTGASVGAAFQHPFAGVDHLAAMLAIGAWAGLAGGRTGRNLPVAFLAALLAGALAGGAGWPLPGVETLIALSVLVAGLCLAAAARPPPAASVALCALFGVAHGHAHGTELLLHGGPWLAVPAFTAGSALLLLLGMRAGSAARAASARAALRLAGLGATTLGVVLLGAF